MKSPDDIWVNPVSPVSDLLRWKTFLSSLGIGFEEQEVISEYSGPEGTALHLESGMAHVGGHPHFFTEVAFDKWENFISIGAWEEDEDE